MFLFLQPQAYSRSLTLGFHWYFVIMIDELVIESLEEQSQKYWVRIGNDVENYTQFMSQIYSSEVRNN